ncbi:RNA-guided endonuclease InsQ/TnpB family protein [Micromonospora sp. URMC 105]|uniref:RNA-guided endonuclease InsQ/TnpB family protein n=1 Tax=Micromonospora sp. URMC 105 TaxID=3423413 RepID=UPI003F19FC7D
MTEVVKRTFKYRFFPTAEQAAQLNRTFGCVRWVYNKALQERSSTWKTQRRGTTYAESSAALTQWKKSEEFAFLNEVSCVPLQQAIRHLHSAFTAFFAKRARYPRFKSKHRSRATAIFTRSAFTWREGRLMLAKMPQPLNIVWSRPLPPGAVPSTVIVSRDRAGRWFVSLRIEDATIHTLPKAIGAVGVDVGITTLATLSTGEVVENPRHERRDRRKLARAQRLLSRKVASSRNREKASVKVARIHCRISDRRHDHLHKLTTRLIRENQTVVVETLSIRNMMRNRTLARAIADAGWYRLRSMLEYKARWYGRTVIATDRWLPSSRRCSACGAINNALRLSDRLWTCDCGLIHDRDVNAARNILAAGLAERENACGGKVRPLSQQRQRRDPTKQETGRAIVGPHARRGSEGGQEYSIRSRRPARRDSTATDRVRKNITTPIAEA